MGMLYGDFYRWAKAYNLFPKPCTKQTLVDFWNEFADTANADTGVPEMSYGGFYKCVLKLGGVLKGQGFFGVAAVDHDFIFEHIDEPALETLCRDRHLFDESSGGKNSLTESFVKLVCEEACAAAKNGE